MSALSRIQVLEQSAAPVTRPIRDTDGHPLAVATIVAGGDPESLAVAERLAARAWGNDDVVSALLWLRDASDALASSSAGFTENVRILAELSSGQFRSEGRHIAGSGQ